ncbi:hypothetical protein C1T31_12570, partial [Hanstruepera neustonica]
MAFLFISIQGFSQISLIGDGPQEAVITTNAVDSNLGCNPVVVPPQFNTDVKCDIIVSTNGPENAGGFDCSFSQTWTAYLSKKCGYVAEPVSVTYTWTEDTLPPKLICNGISGGDLGLNPESIPSGESLIDFFDVDDNCFGAADNSVIFVDQTILDDEGCERSVTYIFKATDPCGNTPTGDYGTCSVTYTWTVDAEDVRDTVYVCLGETYSYEGQEYAAGTYEFPMENDEGCPYTFTLIVEEWPLPVIEIDDQEVCPDVTSVDLTELEPEGQEGGVWTTACGAFDPTAASPLCSPFTYTYIDSNGCVGSDMVAYTFGGTNEEPNTSSAEFCLGDETANICNYASAPVGEIVWVGYTFNGGPLQPIVDEDNDGCPDTPTIGGEYVYFVELMTEDGCVTTSNAAAQITVIDNPIIINCPGDANEASCQSQDAVNAAFDAWIAQFSYEGGTNAVASDLGQYSAPDACGGSVMVTYTVTDDCGLEESCSATFSVEADEEAPVITSNSVSDDLGCNPEIVPPLFKADDNCAGEVELEASTEGPMNDGCNYTQTWTATYTDPCGNAAEPLSITYTWIQSEAIIANVPQDSGVGSCLSQDEVNAAFDAWVATGTITGGCGLDIQIDNPGAPNACGGETTVTWTATSDCAEPIMGSATFTVDPAPEIVANVPQDSGVGSCLSQDEVNAAFDAWVATGTITGGCGLDIQIDNPGAPNACGGETTVTWTATSDCAEPIMGSATFTVDPAPEIVANVPQDSGVGSCLSQDEVNAAFDAWVATGTITGGCGLDIQIDNPGAPNACGGETTVTWTATSDCAEPIMGSATFSVEADEEAPVITSNSESDDLGCNPEIVPPLFKADDNCAGEVELEASTEGPMNDGCNYTQTWTATYTDPCGNEAEPLSITYTWIVDLEAPVITSNSESDDLGCNPEVIAPMFEATDNCGVGEPIVTTEGPTNDGCEYSQTWTANVTDNCGNQAEAVSITYTWTVDMEAPVIMTNNESGDLGCNPAVMAPMFEATDNCGVGEPIVTTEGPTNDGCSYSQTWTANVTDNCGNQAEPVSVTYTWIVDTEAPVISIGELVINGDFSTNQNWIINDDSEIENGKFHAINNGNGGVNSYQNSLGIENGKTYLIEFEVSEYVSGGVRVSVGNNFSSTANSNGSYSQEVTYLAGLTRTYIRTNPGTNLKVDNISIVELRDTDLGCNPEVVPPTFEATDNCGVGEPIVTTEGPTNDGCAYSQTWTANVTDNCGNQAEPVSVTYTWTVDLEAPVITTDNESGDLGCNPEVMAPMFGATDNCGVGEPIVTTEGPTNDGCAYSQTWTANVTDNCGNQAQSVSITYTWTEDTEAPVITPESESGDLGCNPVIVPPTFKVTDNCMQQASLTGMVIEGETEGPTNEGCLYTQTWIANYADACGNQAESVSVTYTWTVDEEAPVITSNSTSDDLGCNPEIVPPLFKADDNCAGEIELEASTEGPTNDGCAYSQTWTATYTDPCGNQAEPLSVTYTWTVDMEAPVITTDNESGDLGCNPEVMAPMFGATDNCGVGEPIVTTEGPTNDGCAYSQTWTANVTDNCGNQAEAVSITYTWTVDMEAPVITTNGQSGDLGCNPEIVPPLFKADDNCAGEVELEASTEGPMNDGCSYSQTWTATYTDPCGNQAEPVSVTYTWIVDTEAPVISADVEGDQFGCNVKPPAPVFTATDNCGVGEPIVTTNGPESSNGCSYSQTWTANVVDNCGNEAEPVSVTYTWTQDSIIPVITTDNESGDLGCNPEVMAPMFGATDNCGVGEPIVTTEGPTNDGCAYSQTWTANVTDNCGNQAEAVSITYTWTVDMEAPVITTNGQSGDLGCNPEIVPPLFKADDNCAGDEIELEASTEGPMNDG